MLTQISRRRAQRAGAAVVVALLGIAGCGGSSSDAGPAADHAAADPTLVALRAAPQLTPPDAAAYRACEAPEISSGRQLGDDAKPREAGRAALRCEAGALTLHVFQGDRGADQEFAATSGRPQGADTPPSAPEGTICSTDKIAFTCMRIDQRLVFVATASTTAGDAAKGLRELTAWVEAAQRPAG